MKAVKGVFLALSFVMAAGLVSCGKQSSNESATVKTVIAVNTQTMKFSKMEDYLDFGGNVNCKNSVQILPDVAGRVTSVSIKEGDKISKGQIIAEVNASRPGQNYSSNPVRSTVSGTVVSIPQSVGSYVSAQSTIAEIATTSELEIKTDIPERFISVVKEGLSAQITFDAYKGESFAAKVISISPVLSPSTRTMEITMDFDSFDERVKAGMYARVHLITQTLDGILCVPSTAILEDGEKYYVYKACEENGEKIAHRLYVTKGLTVDNYTEITEGLAEGDEIVIKGQKNICDGQSVRAINLGV